MKRDNVLKALRSLADPEAVQGMARFGINSKNTLGVSMPNLRKLGKQAGRDHRLAQELWSTGIHEARILAGLVASPTETTEALMDEWVKGFDSWDVCDQVCLNLFWKTKCAHRKAVEWARCDEEYVKRAGFALMAVLAVHDKEAKDAAFRKFLPIIRRAAVDERNFVKKAVNWALRQIGKRNDALREAAIETAEKIRVIDNKAARWIASDALRELTRGRASR